jgi:hypothetical protein
MPEIKKMLLIIVPVVLVVLVLVLILLKKEKYCPCNQNKFPQVTFFLNDNALKLVNENAGLFLMCVNNLQNILQSRTTIIVENTPLKNSEYNGILRVFNPQTHSVQDIAFGKTLTLEFFDELVNKIQSNVQGQSVYPDRESFPLVTLFINNSIKLNDVNKVVSFVNETQDLVNGRVGFSIQISNTLPTNLISDNTGYNAILHVFEPSTKRSKSLGLANTPDFFFNDLKSKIKEILNLFSN